MNECKLLPGFLQKRVVGRRGDGGGGGRAPRRGGRRRRCGLGLGRLADGGEVGGRRAAHAPGVRRLHRLRLLREASGCVVRLLVGGRRQGWVGGGGRKAGAPRLQAQVRGERRHDGVELTSGERAGGVALPCDTSLTTCRSCRAPTIRYAEASENSFFFPIWSVGLIQFVSARATSASALVARGAAFLGSVLWPPALLRHRRRSRLGTMWAALSAPSVRAAALTRLSAAARRTSCRHATNLTGSNNLRVPGASLPSLAPALARRGHGSVALRRAAVVDSDAAYAAEAGTAATEVDETTIDASSSASADADDVANAPEVPDSKLS